MAEDKDKLITVAEREIAKIMAALESDTGMVLDTINVRDIEITEYGDDRQQLLRKVLIKMKRRPGTRWQQ